MTQSVVTNTRVSVNRISGNDWYTSYVTQLMENVTSANIYTRTYVADVISTMQVNVRPKAVTTISYTSYIMDKGSVSPRGYREYTWQLANDQNFSFIVGLWRGQTPTFFNSINTINYTAGGIWESYSYSDFVGATYTITLLAITNTTGTSYLTRSSTSATSYLTRSSTSRTEYKTRASTSGYSGVSSSSSQSSGWL